MFFKSWISNVLKALDAAFNRVAIIASIVAFFGLQYSNVSHSWIVLLILAIYALFIVVIAKPPYVPPVNLAMPIDIDKINGALASTLHVGIIGHQGTGKTTFLNATVARNSVKQQTAKPYGQFVSIPDSSPPKSIVLIDSVGSKEHIQFMVQSMATNLIFMIDHNESDTEINARKDRLANHITLAEQVIHTATDNGVIIDKILIIANKSDLWQQDAVAAEETNVAADTILRMFQGAAPYRHVELRIPYSNESRSDVADLLKSVA